MGLCQIKFGLILVVCISLFTSLSASTFISDDIFGSSVLSERRLLQAKKPCPVNFEFQNYTIITSQCKGPQYAPKLCCSALKDFACPFAEDINDLSNDCASTMFSYINLYGKYPPGLFASECREGKEGLECPALPPSQSERLSNNTNVGHIMICKLLSVLMFVMASIALLLQFI
ncbi:hypothetical protein ACJIZ3_007078 [Penstemon smallii]|uniref:GPI-anchored protein LLG1-like domain-containing protein n=1 Tax=Penstemon smallii TaxID=265156 RepID=A0ABD3SA07_9LAMI